MSAAAQVNDQFSVPVMCANCSQVGAVIWSEEQGPNRSGRPDRKLVRISNGFRAGNAKTQSGDPQIICDNCDEIVPD